MLKHHKPSHNSSLLRVYLILRVIIGLFLLALQMTSSLHTVLGSESFGTFTWTIALYIFVCVCTILIWPPEKLLHSQHRLIGSLLFDVSIMLILLHASGGVSSGLGYLLIVYIAIAAIFMRGHIGYSYAALATVVILGDSIYYTIATHSSDKDLFASGVLGGVLFGTTFTFQFLTERIRTSDLAAATHSAYAEQLQKLAQAIITRMRTGVIVLDEAGAIELINDSAMQLMDLAQSSNGYQNKSPQLAILNHFIHEWLTHSAGKPSKIHTLPSGQEVRINSATLELGDTKQTVLYIEDNRALTQKAQQMKLASLGRLAASIAHEIRNPLGAISHASQLLQESEKTSPEDLRLVDIILQHSARVNQIIENTLSISRRQEAQIISLDLAIWLKDFKRTYEQGTDAQVDLHINSSPLLVRVDTAHLSQVLTNLCDNGARYNAAKNGEQKVTLIADYNSNTTTAFIEVIDRGPGIPEEQVNDIFNPFFTTDEKGTGLGLYISRELCEINQAHLIHKTKSTAIAGTVTCFRIDFSHHQRMN